MTANPQPLFSKTITPARSPQLLSRPRLLDAIHANVDRKLTLISAPAGYGKTSLLTDFVHDTHLPVCWYALDESDRDPALFLATLVAAIGRHAPDLGRAALLAEYDLTPVERQFLLSIPAGTLHEFVKAVECYLEPAVLRINS